MEAPPRPPGAEATQAAEVAQAAQAVEGASSRARVFWTVLGAYALLWQPGAFLNDEVAQAAGLTFLADGHLWVRESDLPEGYAPFTQGLFHHPSFGEPGQKVAPYGSTPLNLLALPVLFVLRGLALAAGVHGALGLAVGTVVGLSAWQAMRRWPDPAIQSYGAVAGAVGFLGLAFGPVAWPGRTPASPYLEFAALQLACMAAAAAAAALLHGLARRRFPARIAWLATSLFAFGTAAAFWAVSAKHHALSILAAVLVLVLLEQGPTSRPRNVAAAVLVAGAATWSFPPAGFLLLLTIALYLLPAWRHGWRAGAARHGAAAAAVLLGLVPFALQWHLQGRAGLGPQFLSQLLPGQGGFAALVDPQNPAGWLGRTAFTDPLGAAGAALQTLVWTDWFRTGPALSFACAFPLMALAFARSPNRLPRRWVGFAVLYAALLFGVTGTFLLEPGTTPDMRYAATLWPFVVLLAMPGLEAALARDDGRWTAWIAPTTVWWMCGTGVGLALAHLAMGSVLGRGFLHEVLLPFRWLGAAIAIVAIGARWTGRLRAWGPPLVTVGAGCAMALQATLLLVASPERSLATPALAWPVELVERGLAWLVGTY